jgi:hypothetical protein
VAFTVRRADAFDADAIADIYYASFRLLTFLPMLHTLLIRVPSRTARGESDKTE